MGPNFYIGNNPGATGRYAPLAPGRETPEFEQADATALAEAAVGRDLAPAQVSDYWMSLAGDYVRSHPGEWFRLLLKKVALCWNAYEIPDTESIYVYAHWSPPLRLLTGVVHFGTVVPLSIAGVVLTWRRRRELWVFYGILIVVTLFTAAFFVLGRYRHPLAPVLILFAGAGIVEVAGAVRVRRWRSLLVPGAAALASALAVNSRINPESELNAAQLANVGVIYATNGDPGRAIDWFRRALDANPADARHHQSLADALSVSGRYREAVDHYAMALGLRPDLPHAQFNLAVALEHIGEKDRALVHYRHALDCDPRDDDARWAIDRLEAAQGGR